MIWHVPLRNGSVWDIVFGSGRMGLCTKKAVLPGPPFLYAQPRAEEYAAKAAHGARDE